MSNSGKDKYAWFLGDPVSTVHRYSLPSIRTKSFAVKNCVTARSAEVRLQAQEAIIGFANQYNLTNIHVCFVLDEKAHSSVLEYPFKSVRKTRSLRLAQML